MNDGQVLLISADGAIADLVTAALDPGSVTIADALEPLRGLPRIVLVDAEEHGVAGAVMEQVRGRFPGTPIVTFGGERSEWGAEDHLPRVLLDGDRIRRVVRSVVERSDLLAEMSWRAALMGDSESRFRSLVQHSADVIGVLDREGAFRHTSPSLESVLGYAATDISGIAMASLAHPDDLAEVETFLALVRAAPAQPRTHSFRILHANGGWIDAEVVATNHLDDALIEGMVINLRDVTERHRRESKLRESEEQYRSMIELMSEGLVELDENQIAVFVNRRLCEMLGYSREALIGRHAHDLLIVPGDRPSLLSELENRRLGQVGRYEVRIRNAQGEWMDVLVSSSPHLDQAGRFQGSISLLTDITERRRAEDEIRQKEQRLEFLIDRVPGSLWTVDRNLRITSSRGAGLALIGYEPEELIGSTLAEYFGSDDPELQEIVMHRQALAGERSVTTNRSGGRVHETVIEPIRAGDGEVTGAFGFAIDVTERRRAEVRLRMQFAVTQILGEETDVVQAIDRVLPAIAEPLDCAVGLFWRPVRGEEGLQLRNSWSAPAATSFVDACASLTLKKNESLPGEVWSSGQPVWSADFRADEPIRSAASIAAGLPYGFALPIAAGGRFWGVLEMVGSCVLNIDGELRAVIEDIARQLGLFLTRVQSQDDIRVSRTRLAEAQSTALIGSWDWDFEMDRVQVSRQFLRGFGVDSEVFDYPFDSFLLLFGTEAEPLLRILTDARRGGEGFEREFSLRLGDQRLRSFHALGTIVTEEGGAGRMIGTVQDVTEQSLLKQDVERAQRLGSLGRMAASIAHEFNNTLMGISPAAELLARRSADPVCADASRRILQSVKRGKRITGEILRFAQPAEPEVGSIEVASWLESMVGELRQDSGTAIDFRLSVPPIPVFIAGDVLQLSQVLINLGLNAKDAMPAGGTVFLTATAARTGDAEQFGLSSSGPFVHLEICDTGTGIDPETVQQIFEPLFTTKRSGTGLGLAVVHQIIKQHHGHIVVSSEPGRGSTFHLFLPAAVQRAMAPALVPVIHVVNKKLLLVEDDELVAAGLSEMLRMEGFEVEVVGEGRAVLPAIGRFHPDAVVLDVGLPDMAGTDVFREIESRYPSLAVVFSTGHADPGLITRSYRQHRIGFLQKPYDVSTLLSVLADAMV